MSTPSTLPPPHHPNYGYSHHHNYQSNGGYRANNILLNGGSRLGAPYNFPTPSSNGTSSNSVGVADPSRASQNTAHSSSRPETKAAAMPISSSTSVSKPNPKKRQRTRDPREPDWHKFYRHHIQQLAEVVDMLQRREDGMTLPMILSIITSPPTLSIIALNTKTRLDPPYQQTEPPLLSTQLQQLR
jgi:dual-specificity kinase